MAGALAGLKVVDLSAWIAGPICGMLLADMGARVVKVEPPEGDNFRLFFPALPREGRAYMMINRGKQVISLDLSKPEGLEVVRRLIADADVVVINFRPGVAEKLGLDYETLCATNPGLIYCTNTGWGTEGPDAGKAGFDIAIQAATGLMTLEANLKPGVTPDGLGLPIIDVLTGTLMFGAVCAALHARNSSGRGQRIDTSLLASALMFQSFYFTSVEQIDAPLRSGWLDLLAQARARHASFDEVVELRRQVLGSGAEGRRQREPYRGTFHTADGLIVINANGQRHRRRFMTLFNLRDSRLEGEVLNDEESRRLSSDLADQVEEALRAEPTAVWVERLGAAHIPAAPVRFLEELFDDPQVLANGLLAELTHATAGSVKMLTTPVVMHGTPAAPAGPPPALHEHTEAILRSLGFDDATIERLRALGVVF
jgi:crotonobetainyl-CoA:carnitine CoA-transferase CaiB-like acyl-CoA transferase